MDSVGARAALQCGLSKLECQLVARPPGLVGGEVIMEAVELSVVSSAAGSLLHVPRL